MVIGGQAGTNNRVLLYSLIFLVALGVALTRTGGVITSAGLILAGTFAVLMTQPLNSLLQFGFAMAVGILLDTFLIRGALVPALFHLIGPRIWYPGRRADTVGRGPHPG